MSNASHRRVYSQCSHANSSSRWKSDCHMYENVMYRERFAIMPVRFHDIEIRVACKARTAAGVVGSGAPWPRAISPTGP